MAAQPTFFKKNRIDLSNPAVNITVEDSVAYSTGQPIVDFLRNRNNRSAWMTTESNDSANTTLTVEIGDLVYISDIILVNHNFKSFKITYNDGNDWLEFAQPIDITDCNESTTRIEFPKVEVTAIKILIRGTQVADEDKRMTQLILTEFVGKMESWPQIKAPTHSTNRRKSKMLSGKSNFIESAGSFMCEFSIASLSNQADLAIIEAIYNSRQGVLLWLGGGDESQFKLDIMGFRKQDFFLVRPSNDYVTEFYKGIYQNGVKISVKFEECTE